MSLGLGRRRMPWAGSGLGVSVATPRLHDMYTLACCAALWGVARADCSCYVERRMAPALAGHVLGWAAGC